MAYRFLGAGFAAFVLRYSCCGKKFPTDLLECAAAVKYVRENAENFDIDPDKIFVMGFSAGGSPRGEHGEPLEYATAGGNARL